MCVAMAGHDLILDRSRQWRPWVALVSTGHVNTCDSDTHQLSVDTHTVNISQLELSWSHHTTGTGAGEFHW